MTNCVKLDDISTRDDTIFHFFTVATVQFQLNQYYVNESDSTVRIAVILTGIVADPILTRYDFFYLMIQLIHFLSWRSLLFQNARKKSLVTRHLFEVLGRLNFCAKTCTRFGASFTFTRLVCSKNFKNSYEEPLLDALNFVLSLR